MERIKRAIRAIDFYCSSPESRALKTIELYYSIPETDHIEKSRLIPLEDLDEDQENPELDKFLKGFKIKD